MHIVRVKLATVTAVNKLTIMPQVQKALKKNINV